MRYADVDNIWQVDLATLSNADRGRIFFERAKQVITVALADPEKFEVAVDGHRFRRSYLVGEVGCQPAVTTQNPKIKQLLADTDRLLAKKADTATAGAGRRTPGSQSIEVVELRATVDALRRRVDVQAVEIAELRRKLREAGWVELDMVGQGRMPW